MRSKENQWSAHLSGHVINSQNGASVEIHNHYVCLCKEAGSQARVWLGLPVYYDLSNFLIELHSRQFVKHLKIIPIWPTVTIKKDQRVSSTDITNFNNGGAPGPCIPVSLKKARIGQNFSPFCAQTFLDNWKEKYDIRNHFCWGSGH